jgi:hypothetical protein
LGFATKKNLLPSVDINATILRFKPLIGPLGAQTLLAMKNTLDTSEKPLYQKPVLKMVKIRPREVLGSGCHSSSTPADMPCDGYAECAL